MKRVLAKELLLLLFVEQFIPVAVRKLGIISHAFLEIWREAIM